MFKIWTQFTLEETIQCIFIHLFSFQQIFMTEKNVDFCIADMTNQQLMDRGNNMMDETDQAIDRAQKVYKLECTIAFLDSFIMYDDSFFTCYIICEVKNSFYQF